MNTPLRKLFDIGAEAAKQLFDLLGYVNPTWFGVDKNGSNVPLLITDLSDKDKAAESVREFLRQHDVSRYVSILECWMYEGKEVPQEILEGRSLEHNPDRREAIQIIAEDNEGNVISGVFYILRPEHGKPKLSPIRMMPENADTEGWFVRMFANRRVAPSGG